MALPYRELVRHARRWRAIGQEPLGDDPLARRDAAFIAEETALLQAVCDACYAPEIEGIADVDAHWLSGDTGLGELLRAAFLRFEDRLAMQSLKAQIGSREAEAAQLEKLTRTYYTSFAPLRALLLTELPAATPAPAAVLVWGDGGIDVVLVGKARSAAEAREVVEGTLREAAQGLARALERKLPAGTRYLREEDLGLGVPALVIETAWMRALAGGSFGPAVRADLAPHLFFIDGQLVLSTSVRASQRVLAAQRGGARLGLPAAPGGGVISVLRVKRRALVAAADALFGWLGSDATVDRVRQLARSVLGLVDQAELVETGAGDERRTTFEARFAVPR